MNLVSNFIGEISSFKFGDANGVVQNSNLDDDVFSNILEKQLQERNENFFQMNSIHMNVIDGMPLGDLSDIQNVEKLNTTDIRVNKNENYLGIEEKECSVEEIAYMSSPFLSFSSNDDSQSEIFDFAQKQAANLYHKYSRSPIDNLEDFVSKIQKIVK